MSKKTQRARARAQRLTRSQEEIRRVLGGIPRTGTGETLPEWLAELEHRTNRKTRGCVPGRMTAPEAMERGQRVAAILGVPCGRCHAVAGASCTVTWGAESSKHDAVARLDSYGTVAHLHRVERAVRLGRIPEMTVAAQFGYLDWASA